jgi:hypothetical protein
MANSLGSLVVSLGLDAAEFTRGMTKAEQQSAQFARKMESNFKSVARFIATLGVGAIIAKFTTDTISAASALDDLADATGSSVENLSKLSNQAKISGTSFETLQGLVLKLTAGMAGADDESSNVGRALKFLGVNAKDPAEALQQVAVALDKYADGIGKAALARDLFGKGGPAFLGTLKDIANLQDVQATVTGRQAAEAEKLEQAWRRLSTEGSALKNMVLSLTAPVADLIEQMREGIKIAGGFGNALRLFSTLPMVGSVNDAADALAKINTRIQDIEAGKGLEGVTARLTGQKARIVADLNKQRAFLELQLRQQIDAATGKKGGAADDLTVKLPAAYTGSKDKDAAKMAKGVDEFARALENIRKMAAGAQVELNALADGTEKLTHAEKALAQLQADDVWQKFNETQRQQLVSAYQLVAGIEKETEVVRKRREEYDKHLQTLQDQAEHEVKTRAAIKASVADYEQQNDSLRRSIAIIGQSDLAHQKLAATLDYEHRRREILAKDVIDLEQLSKLEQAYAERQSLLESQDAANKQLAETQKNKQFVDDLAGAFTNAAEEAIVMGRSFKDVMKGLEQDLLRIITRRLVTEPLGNAISGMLGSALFGMAGAGAAGAGAMGAPMGGPIGAMMPSYASGTNYHPGGWAKVHKDEVVNLPRGAQVVSNERLLEKRGERTSVTQITINQAPGVSRKTGMQAADEMTRRQLQAGRIR